ncbi:hypothetical protein N431DRAFT_543391 [Stipitochalara longipes BDJ]|nr:hypothetical protein N431DRAFT_543391 [Stipitochalara longipes BDJ]
MMRPSTQREQLCLILAASYAATLCEASKIELRSAIYSNSTTSSLSSSSTKEKATVTPTPTLLSSSSTANYSSTITSAPVYPWGDQSIPINTCSVTASGGVIQWTPCAIFAGTVAMSYFPESWGIFENKTYTEYFDTDFGVTMTSPSIYMRVNTVTGENSCGPLGPTFANQVISMDLTDVLTLQPYADHTVTTRMGPPIPLTLSDLTSDCQNTYATFSTDGAYVNTHPVYGMYNRCHPRFEFPIQIKRLGYPYWAHCGNDNYTYGIFDPPGAVPPVSGLLPITPPAAYTSTYEPASALPTTAPVAETSPAPPPAAPTSPPTNPATPSPPPNSGNPPASNNPPAPPATPASNNSPAPPATPVSNNQPAPPATTPPVQVPTSATGIATVGSQTISAIPGSSGVVLPNGSTAKPGSVATLTDSNSKPVVVSVGSSGVFIGGTSSGAPTSFFANPTIPPPPPPPSTPIATIAGQVVSAAPGDSSVVIGGQTIKSGGGAVTLSGSNNVASLGASGLVIQGPSGSISTFALPTAAPAPPKAIIGTVGGNTVSAAAGGSVVWVGTQAVTFGGPVATVSNNVVTLGPSGLEIMAPGGIVTTIPFTPQLTSSAAGVLATAPTSSKALGAIIASIAGGTEPDKAIGSPSSSVSSSLGHGGPTAASKNAAGKVDSRYQAAWLGLAFCVVLGLGYGR